MKLTLKKREAVLLCILAALACVFLYYYLYFQPNREQAAQIQNRIVEKTKLADEAMQRVIEWSVLSNEKISLENKWAEAVKNLPERFDNAAILMLIDKIIIPYTQNVGIRFADRPVSFKMTKINSVDLTFTVRYDVLQKIITAFDAEETYSRIIALSCTYTDNLYADSTFNVSMKIEFLTS